MAARETAISKMTATTAPMGWYTTRLARVQTPTPRVVALNAFVDGAAEEERALGVRVVVQVRPQLLHFVLNGQLMCVLRSDTEICAVAECSPEAVGNSPQLLVATTDGSLYLVGLPLTRQSSTKPIHLKQTAGSSGTSTGSRHAFVRRVADVPGVQQLRYIASLDAVVCTSLLTPTTVVRGIHDPKCSSQVEIDALEGEQSTCVAVVNRGQRGGGGVTVLQGDTDGFVRAALVGANKPVSVSEILQLREPVLAILPLSAVGGLDEEVLVVGVRGTVAVVLSSSTNAKVLRGRFPVAVDSAVLLLDDIEPSLVLVTKAKKILVTSLAALLTQLEHLTDVHSNISNVDLTATAITHANLQGIVSIGSHGSPAGVVSFLNTSGLLFSMHRDELFVSDPTKSSTPAIPSELRVKSLLQEIATLSQRSDQLQKDSRQADDVLNALNSALRVRQLVDTRGLKALGTCRLNMKLVASGWAMQTKSVLLRYVFQPASAFVHSLLSGSSWRIAITVRAGESSVFSYNFTLSSCEGMERSIELDNSVLHQVDGVIRVSSELIFVPGSTETTKDGAGKGGHRNCQLASFAIPMTRSQCFHLVQLSEPIAEFPTNPSALRDLFRQDHELLINSNLHPLRQGYEWWPVILQFATDIGVNLQRPDGGQARSGHPPLRFVLQVIKNPGVRSSKSSNAQSPTAVHEDEALALLARIFNIKSDEERAAWRAASREVGGKWWVGTRTHTGNLIVLRLSTPSPSNDKEDGEASHDCMEITVQSSSVSDLAAMRALITHAYGETVTTPSNKTWSAHDVTNASLALSSTRDELASQAAIMEDLNRKLVANANEEVQPIDLCQDEWLQLLQRTAQVETRSIDLYWKSREVVNQRLAF